MAAVLRSRHSVPGNEVENVVFPIALKASLSSPPSVVTLHCHMSAVVCHISAVVCHMFAVACHMFAVACRMFAVVMEY